MFFEPPKVRSLSRYAEFGVNLHHRHFLVMLCIALFLHAAVIAVYAILPGEAVIRIPVRVLNLKLSGGPDAMDMPLPVMMPQVEAGPEAQKLSSEKPSAPDAKDVSGFMQSHSAQTALDDVMGEESPTKTRLPADANPKAPRLPAAPKPAHAAQKKAARESDDPENAVPSPVESDLTLSTPKKYVREGEGNGETGKSGKASAKAETGGNGSGLSGAGKGEEIVQRYEQVVSLWIANHKAYPEEAKRKHIEGDAVVRIRISRDGHILYSAIDKSSGSGLIDAAAIAMVKASDPVPAAPGDYPEASKIEFLIPVEFYLK